MRTIMDRTALLYIIKELKRINQVNNDYINIIMHILHSLGYAYKQT